MRKSQIHAQAFVYILAIIIMAMILAYGYTAVKDITKKGEFTALVKFKTDLKTSITSISHDYGSVKNQEFVVPTKFRQVCFVELSSSTLIPEEKYPIVNNYVKSVLDNNAEPRNVFLLPPGTESEYIGNITVANNGFLCFNVTQGRINIRLEGLGNRVKIS